MNRKALWFVVRLALFAFVVWFVADKPHADINNEQQVREWATYQLAHPQAPGRSPLELQRLDRAGNRYEGVAVEDGGRIYTVSLEQEGEHIRFDARWKGENESEVRSTNLGRPPYDVRHPWVEWWPVATVVCWVIVWLWQRQRGVESSPA